MVSAPSPPRKWGARSLNSFGWLLALTIGPRLRLGLYHRGHGGTQGKHREKLLIIFLEKAPRRLHTPRSAHSTGCARLPRTCAGRRERDAALSLRCAPTGPGPLPPASLRAAPETEFPDRNPSVQFSATERCVARRLGEKL